MAMLHRLQQSSVSFRSVVEASFSDWLLAPVVIVGDSNSSSVVTVTEDGTGPTGGAAYLKQMVVWKL